MPQAMAWYEDVDYIKGTGAGEPQGVLSSQNQGLLVQAKATGQGAATIVWENVIAMYSRLLPVSIDNAVWLASPDTFSELATMALSVGTGGSAVWLMDGRGRPVLTLLGLPVIRTEKTPGYLGQQGDLSLIDFSFYLVGQRDAMSMDTSEHVRFTRDQTTIRVIQRNDGRPWLASPITPQNGGPTLSPFVTLQARA
jgi:HK97 family phage major capsid protein